MGNYPISKFVAQDYRESLQTADAPSFVDTDLQVLPVIDIQKGFPKPNARQQLKTYMVSKGIAADQQIATTGINTRIYFLGFESTMNAGNLIVGDATSGTLAGADAATNLLFYSSVAATTYTQFFPTLPREVKTGLRVTASAAISLIMYYIEETII